MSNLSAKRQVLAGFEHAHRLAIKISEHANINIAVTQTGDPSRPFKISLTDPNDRSQIFRTEKG